MKTAPYKASPVATVNLSRPFFVRRQGRSARIIELGSCEFRVGLFEFMRTEWIERALLSTIEIPDLEHESEQDAIGVLGGQAIRISRVPIERTDCSF